MWRDYSKNYIKHNRAASTAIAVSALISSLLLSLAGLFFYNLWMDNESIRAAGEKAQSSAELMVYLIIMLAACVSLVMIIHNAFEVTMRARIHQFGILKSVGATPRQIRSALLQEAFVLCLAPIAAGLAIGTGLCGLIFRYLSAITVELQKRELTFHVSPLVLAMAFAAAAATVWLSAWIPARKLSAISPLEAIRYGTERPIGKMRRFRLISSLFGIEGELAAKSIYARRRAYRTSTLSLTIAFLAFASFLNFEKISALYTSHTYFERYEDKWDVMATVTNMAGEQELLAQIRDVPGVSDCIGYQKASAYTGLAGSSLSKALVDADGTDWLVKKEDANIYETEVPLVVLDDESFQSYYGGVPRKTGAEYEAGGVVLVNQIWSRTSGGNRKYIAYVKEPNQWQIELYGSLDMEGRDPVSVPVLAYADEMPRLRGEVPQNSLLLVMSAEHYQAVKEQLPVQEYYLNIKTTSDDVIDNVYLEIQDLLEETANYTIENRLEAKEMDTQIRNAYKLVIGGFCSLLALIGLANVFSNAIGQIYQRRREFARYQSVGMSPKGMSKILLIEAMLIVLRPVLFGLVVNVFLIYFGLRAALIPAAEFIQNMPAVPILTFIILLLAFVGVAYYIGGRRICKDNVADMIRNDCYYS